MQWVAISLRAVTVTLRRTAVMVVKATKIVMVSLAIRKACSFLSMVQGGQAISHVERYWHLV